MPYRGKAMAGAARLGGAKVPHLEGLSDSEPRDLQPQEVIAIEYSGSRADTIAAQVCLRSGGNSQQPAPTAARVGRAWRRAWFLRSDVLDEEEFAAGLEPGVWRAQVSGEGAKIR